MGERYKGRGEHSVNALEKMVEERNERIIQLKQLWNYKREIEASLDNEENISLLADIKKIKDTP